MKKGTRKKILLKMFRRDSRKLHFTSCLLKRVDVLPVGLTVHHQVEQVEETGTQVPKRENEQSVTGLVSNKLFREHQLYKRM